MAKPWGVVVFALVALAVAGNCDTSQSAAGLVEDIWETAQIDGVKIGYAHTRVQEHSSPEGKRLLATCDLDLTFRRQGSVLRLHVEQGTEELADGRVVGVFMRQGQAGGPRLELIGNLEDGKMHVKVDGGRSQRRLTWPEGILGWYGREHFFQKAKPRSGDRLTFLTYEPTFNTVLTMRVAVKGPEDVALPGGSRRLLRVDMTPHRLEVPGQSIQPPGAVWWLDDNCQPVRRQFELEGLGAVVLTRSTRTVAQAPSAGGAAVDIGARTLVPLNRAIPEPYDTRLVIYRITLAGDSKPATAVARDAHQEVWSLEDEGVELRVHPLRRPEPRSGAAPAPTEYLASCHYIDWDNPRVRALGRKAAGDETDPWRKARRIERWVKQTMRVDNTAPFVPASQIAANRWGDCRHFALLSAALCRAEGLPSRLAVGLLYVERGGRPHMGFHMWTEVYLDGSWMGLDATLGRGGVSAAHLKISDHSWKDVQSLTPLLPVYRILGKIRIEVLRVEGDR
jgi:transglutaminase-like putative cysteine protease